MTREELITLRYGLAQQWAKSVNAGNMNAGTEIIKALAFVDFVLGDGDHDALKQTFEIGQRMPAELKSAADEVLQVFRSNWSEIDKLQTAAQMKDYVQKAVAKVMNGN